MTIDTININTYFDKIFYINLEKDVARNEHMISEFTKFGITNFERIDAIVLREITTPDTYRNFIKKEPKYVLGSLSCRASHIKCITTAKERGYSKVLILEDDISFLNDPSELLVKNAATLTEWDMLYFGGLIEPHFRNQIVGGYAYAVNSSLFDNIVYMAAASGMEIDNFYAKILQHMSYNYNASGRYNVKIITPFNAIAHKFVFNSNIQME